MTTAAYLRTSTSAQETAAQRGAVEQWIAAKSYAADDVIWFVDDGISGKTTDRVQFQRLLAEVRAGRIDRIITFELSRFSRDFLDLLEIMRTFSERGVTVEVPGEGAVPFGSTLQQFLVAARSLASAQERENISARTKAGLAAARARGVKLGRPKGSGGKRRGPKDYERDEPELLRDILFLHSKGNSTVTIARALKTSRNKIWRLLRRYATSR